jgi:hypothetical protein
MIKLPKDDDGFENTLVVMDNFLKYVELFPIKVMDAESVAKCLVSLFARYSKIQQIRSDRGANFVVDIYIYVAL